MEYKHFNSFGLFILLFFMNDVDAQNLADHRWQNRLLLIKADLNTPNLYQQQLKILKGDEAGLKERKLLIYHIKNQQYRKGLNSELPYQNITDNYLKRVSNSKFDFEIILIGLDGGVKLRQDNVLKIDKLFGIIDAMPMRRWELERR